MNKNRRTENSKGNEEERRWRRNVLQVLSVKLTSENIRDTNNFDDDDNRDENFGLRRFGDSGSAPRDYAPVTAPL